SEVANFYQILKLLSIDLDDILATDLHVEALVLAKVVTQMRPQQFSADRVRDIDFVGTLTKIIHSLRAHKQMRIPPQRIEPESALIVWRRRYCWRVRERAGHRAPKKNSDVLYVVPSFTCPYITHTYRGWPRTERVTDSRKCLRLPYVRGNVAHIYCVWHLVKG